MAVINDVMFGKWADLQDYCQRMAADKLLAIIAEKKAGVIAKLNGITEAFGDDDENGQPIIVDALVDSWMNSRSRDGYAEVIDGLDINDLIDDVNNAGLENASEDEIGDYLDSNYLGESVVVTEAKKEDPKAAVRNKADCVFDNTSKLVKDNKDHFPIDTEAKGRNALAQVNKYKTVPKWFDGTLEALVKKVVSAVRKKYPKIKITKAAVKPGKN